MLSHSVVSDSVTPWTVALQAPLSMGFPNQEYWSGLSFSPPRELSDPGIEPASPALAGRFSTLSHQGNPIQYTIHIYIYILFFRFFFIIGYYKILNIIPCAIQ